MSTASSERSQTSSGTDDTLSPSSSAKRLRPQKPPSASPDSRTSLNILLFLVAFRILNALCVRTFFQPDEFFQSLEPAWDIVFGEDSGAWITWEWRHHLRSSIHPYIFAGVYYVSNLIASGLSLSPLSRADLLIVAPKVTQALFAALGDYFTWKLARLVYGPGSVESWGSLALTVASPWQWFCSTRTLSNCLETTLTVIALYLWPWQWSSENPHDQQCEDDNPSQHRLGRSGDQNDLFRLRICLLLAALACVLRPTNLMIWVCLVSFVVFNNPPSTWLRQNRSESATGVYTLLIRETILCGCTVLITSVLADRVYFGSWTLPPLKFLYFNLAQSLAVFYGSNDWHYYLAQGYPLLLTTALPFALSGLYHGFFPPPSESAVYRQSIRRQLAWVCVFMPSVLSLISHKEVRFIYPLLPSLHVLTGPPLARWFAPAISSSSGLFIPRRLTLIFLILVNSVIAYYVSISHASGTINILQYLREQHDHLPAKVIGHDPFSTDSFDGSPGMTVGFFMPCHSTPWRSHLIFPTIDAWALSCEPPVNLNATQKAAYVDEADQFYDDPVAFLHDNMIGGTRHIPGRPSYQTNNPQVRSATITPPGDEDDSLTAQATAPTKHNWPDYLIFFAQLEPLLQNELRSSSYAECYRTWNTAWHDDSRRKGDMVVWCLDPTSQRDWQRQRQQRKSRQLSSQHDQLRKREKHFDKIVEGLKKEAGVTGQDRRQKNFWSGIVSSLTTPSWSWRWQWPRNFNLQPPSSSSSPLSSFLPLLKKKKTVWISWLDDGLYLERPRWSPWSWSWPWARQKKVWWRRDWMTSFMEYWQKNVVTGGSSEPSDDHERNLWS